MLRDWLRTQSHWSDEEKDSTGRKPTILFLKDWFKMDFYVFSFEVNVNAFERCQIDKSESWSQNLSQSRHCPAGALQTTPPQSHPQGTTVRTDRAVVVPGLSAESHTTHVAPTDLNGWFLFCCFTSRLRNCNEISNAYHIPEERTVQLAATNMRSNNFFSSPEDTACSRGLD